jgi:hypothetical protein
MRWSWPRARRYGAVVCASLLLAAAVVSAYLGILANGMRCDDSCQSEPPLNELWWLDPNAAQWDTQLWLALGALGFAALAFALTLKRRYAAAALCAPVTVGLGVEWIAILHEGHWGGF